MIGKTLIVNMGVGGEAAVLVYNLNLVEELRIEPMPSNKRIIWLIYPNRKVNYLIAEYQFEELTTWLQSNIQDYQIFHLYV